MKWLFHERFSWFDLICIAILIQVVDFVLKHLTWN